MIESNVELKHRVDSSSLIEEMAWRHIGTESFLESIMILDGFEASSAILNSGV